MKHFIIKAFKRLANDPFGMYEADEFLCFYCAGLADLRKTMRCITAKGYRIKKERWFSENLKQGVLELHNPFFGTPMFEIKQIPCCPKVEMHVDYTNTFGFAHRLKKASNDQWECLEVGKSYINRAGTKF